MALNDTLPELESRRANAILQKERSADRHDRGTWDLQIKFLNMMIADKRKSLGMVNPEDT
jgi:hypothetical protein